MDNISIGLTLMIIGMVTVFAILLIVVWLGNGLIRLVNRLAPEAEAAGKKVPTGEVDALTLEIIRTAVKQTTGGTAVNVVKN